MFLNQESRFLPTTIYHRDLTGSYPHRKEKLKTYMVVVFLISPVSRIFCNFFKLETIVEVDGNQQQYRHGRNQGALGHSKD